ncbi:sialate O-acetylesterase [uncultured Polaribacter sp.]|uniref:sialate O-acetylesterase n=1 Tax=uncultured Polaribacter sp. TaxID=174711 RepID=UPI002601BC23|nr:sialate O-acetylesterase [uncultured Polaribacter sp.]
MKIGYKLASILFIALPQFLMANVTLHALFSDHMVIQRETEIPVWGWADPFEKVEVLGSWGKKASTATKADGSWMVNLKTPKAGGPFTIRISGKNTITISDVLSGEVWLCSGQSNMDYTMERFSKGVRDKKYQPLADFIKDEVANANDDWLRHIEVSRQTSLDEKKTNFTGKWIKAKKDEVNKITATGYFFAKELRERLNVPIGLVECSWGGSRIQPWISEEAYLNDKNLQLYYRAMNIETKNTIKNMDAKGFEDTVYKYNVNVWEQKGKKGRKPKGLKHPREDMQVATTLYNGMLNAIIPYKIKGTIWYQGESNAVYLPEDYEEFLTTMVTSWRSDWNQGDFSFYWAQLAACNRGSDEASKGWATVNDELRKTLKVPNTGMAVLYDIGEPNDIHPHNKMDVGKRLAYWALAKDYKMKVKAVSGPLYKSVKIQNNKIEIDFTHTGSGLMVGHKHLLEDAVSVNEPLKWFEIVGDDGVWKPAEAKIVSKDKIEVWNTSVPNPKHVRYAWAGNPEGANLYNKEGLPAAVFSTEQ